MRPLRGECRKGVYASRISCAKLLQDLDTKLSRDSLKETFVHIANTVNVILFIFGLLAGLTNCVGATPLILLVVLIDVLIVRHICNADFYDYRLRHVKILSKN